MKAEFKSKFKSLGNQSLRLIEPLGDGEGLHISVDHGSDGARGIVISVEDAVRLAGKALRISRASVVLDSHDIEDVTSNIECIVENLDIEEENKSIEDFALELYNVYRVSYNVGKIFFWPNESLKRNWLEVAKVAYKK